MYKRERERRHSAFGEDMGVATDIEIEMGLMWCRIGMRLFSF
jgi:hypothetical protein